MADGRNGTNDSSSTGPGDNNRTVPLFPLGQIVATPGAAAALHNSGQEPLDLLLRHVQGDWGSPDEEDRQANHQALKSGARLLSAYTLKDGVTRLWVITEANRSATTLILPAE